MYGLHILRTAKITVADACSFGGGRWGGENDVKRYNAEDINIPETKQLISQLIYKIAVSALVQS
jgi:hypothetical protein